MKLETNCDFTLDVSSQTIEYNNCSKSFKFKTLESVAQPTIHSRLLVSDIEDLYDVETALDIGCGIGFVGIIVAGCLHLKHTTCVDIQEDAVALTRINAKANNVEKNLVAVKNDIIADYLNQKFDLILSNPSQSPEPPQSTRNLPYPSAAGKDGLSFVRKLMPRISNLLSETGTLKIVLHEFLGNDSILSLFREHGFVANITATANSEMSKNILALKPYIEQELQYSFPLTPEGLPFCKVSVFTAKKI